MEKWNIIYAPNSAVKNIDFCSVESLKKYGFEEIPGEVPGMFEISLMKAGKLPDLYYSENTLLAQRLEATHVFYYTYFDMPNENAYLHFGGVDTIADIYVNGELVKSNNNMFVGFDVFAPYKKSDNELLVHIKPACIEARKYPVPVACNAQPYNAQSLYIRKAAHCYGWDIMPRIVTSGIWKPVEIRQQKKDDLKEIYLMTNSINVEERSANLCLYVNAELSEDIVQDYTVKIRAVHKDSEITFEKRLWHNSARIRFRAENVYFWWPKNAGEPSLYDMTVELYHNGELRDSKTQKVGIRTIELDRTESVCENGKFNFMVNGKKVFILGTNWVPLDAFHSEDDKRLDKALLLLDEINCNMVRCWGGNVYESERFFDFCDEHGIMIWQDFAMGCAVYPEDDLFIEQLKYEATAIIKEKRAHASLALWAGDNECDLAYKSWGGISRNPEENVLTREVLPQLLKMHDPTREYLASSPYVSGFVHINGLKSAEGHLWGPRDYFKGDYYKNAECYFASETGYHGCPSPKSLKKFLKEPEKMFNDDASATNEYIVHASSPVIEPNSQYAKRIRLMANQVDTLFNEKPKNLSEFASMSQISQAEAKKYFVERFRINKPTKGGIIWWNLIDGWPQVSDAIVDYYYTKKLAFSYLKRSQNPVCLMFDEPEGDSITLYGVNDLTKPVDVSYQIKNITEDTVIYNGAARLNPDCSSPLFTHSIKKDEKNFYLISYTVDGIAYKNHYFTNIKDITYKSYIDALEICDFNEFEQF